MASFGKYRLLAQIGEGGMAEVFLAVARAPANARSCALTVIKRLRANVVDDPEVVAMLVDEARLAARLDHPNVVRTDEVGDVDGRTYLAMEYLEAQSLNRIQNRSMARARKGAEDKTVAPSPLTKEMQYVVLLDVLAGLHHAHELRGDDGLPLNVVHRDVTPQNVLVTYDGHAKVIDFGIAKASGRATETRPGVVKGKARYMAPEQALANDVDRRADVFAVGVLLWEVAAGTRRWKNQSEAEIVRSLVSDGGYLPLREIDATVPEAIEAICKKALSLEPEDRYQTADELRMALEDHLVAMGKLVDARAGLGEAVVELCKDSRAELKSVIEKQLANLDNENAASSSPVSATQIVTDAGAGAIATTPTSSSSKKGLVFAALAVVALVVVANLVLRLAAR